MENAFIKSHLPQIARIALGLIFTISGLNYIFGFFQITYSVAGTTFIQNLQASGFVWPVLKITELVCGTLLLFGYFGPLTLFILAPITLGIVLFHVFLSPANGAILGYVVFLLEVVLIVYWRKYYVHILRDFSDDVDHNPMA